jgi:hypothetical protein
MFWNAAVEMPQMLWIALGEMPLRSFTGRLHCEKRCEVTLPLKVNSQCLQPAEIFAGASRIFHRSP